MNMIIISGALLSFALGINSKNIFLALAAFIQLIVLCICCFQWYIQCDNVIIILSLVLDFALFLIGLIIKLKLDE